MAPPTDMYYCCVIASLFIILRSIVCSNDTDFSSIGNPFSVSYQNTSEPTENSVLNLNNSLLQSLEGDSDDSGKIAGIVIGVLSITAVVVSVMLFVAHKYFLRKSMTSLNFDNPVYRKTTEDQFSLEKNQYHPARSYPSSLEPLTSPGTNEFV